MAILSELRGLPRPATAGFLWLFIGDAVTSIVYGIIALASLPDGAPTDKSSAGWLHAIRHARTDQRFLRVLASSVLASCLLFQFESTPPLHVVDSGFTCFGWKAGFESSVFANAVSSRTRRRELYPNRRRGLRSQESFRSRAN